MPELYVLESSALASVDEGDDSFRVGKSGSLVVTPGDLDASEMFYRVTTDDEDDRMPPPDEHDALSKKEVALIEE